MLERAALHQTRFRTPGVQPDARGVVLGHRGLALFPSLDRLVAFLRAYGEGHSFDELLPSLEIQQLETPLKTRELALWVAAESSYRMDRIAGLARLTGGLVFTGTQRHFVKYRDAASPLGYDVPEIVQGELVLYHDTFRQSYGVVRPIHFRDLVLKLTPVRIPPSERRRTSSLWATAEPGMGSALVTYLFRWQVEASTALAEWPAQSAFEDRPRRLHLFRMDNVPDRITALLSGLPGVTLFEPVGEAVAVQLGYEHPIALETCSRLFDDDALHLFRGDGEVVKVAPRPPFASVSALVRVALPSLDGTLPTTKASPGTDPTRLELVLRLSPTIEPWRKVVATIVSAEQRAWLARLLYAIPEDTLRSLQIAMAHDRFYLLSDRGIEGVPLGLFHYETAPRLYVPAGYRLIPAVTPTVLEQLVRDRGSGHVFFDLATAEPRLVPAEAFGPVSRKLLRELAAVTVHADRPDDTDPPLPLLQYGEAHRFPLWGAVGGGAVGADEATGTNAQGEP